RGLYRKADAALAAWPAEPGTRAAWAWRVALAVFPVFLSWLAYDLPSFDRQSPHFPVIGDTAFPVYQLARAADLRGRWGRGRGRALGADPLPGRACGSFASARPGVYEGVGLTAASALSGRFLDPVTNYRLRILLVLCLNGWIVAWMTRRLTGSFAWAALAEI